MNTTILLEKTAAIKLTTDLVASLHVKLTKLAPAPTTAACEAARELLRLHGHKPGHLAERDATAVLRLMREHRRCAEVRRHGIQMLAFFHAASDLALAPVCIALSDYQLLHLES